MSADKEGIDEERRLFYVAITRAKRWLSIYFPLRWFRRRGGVDDRHDYAQLTRFLPESIRPLFDEEVVEHEMTADIENGQVEGKPAETVDRLLTSLFSK